MSIYCNLVLSFTNCNSGYKAASLPPSFSGLKAVTTKSGDVRFVVYGQPYGNGTAYNEKLVTTPQSSAQIYDSICQTLEHLAYYYVQHRVLRYSEGEQHTACDKKASLHRCRMLA